MNRRTFLKFLAVLPCFGFLKPEKGFSELKNIRYGTLRKKYPETVEEMKNMLQMEFPRSEWIHSDSVSTDEWFMNSDVAKIKYEDVKQSEVKTYPHNRYFEEWPTTRLAMTNNSTAYLKETKRAIKTQYLKIRADAIKHGRKSIYFRANPQITTHCDFMSYNATAQLYTRLIFI